MIEIGLGERFILMKDEEKGFRVSLERLRILAGRLKKVLKAKNDLLYIFKVLLQFQK